MTEPGANKIQSREGWALRRLILIVAWVLCLGLLASALFTFAILERLRLEYLSNRGHEIVSAIEAQVRGPGRRSNPQFWQPILESARETYAIALLALVDANGHVLAGNSGDSRASLDGKTPEGGSVYIYEETLPPPRNPRGEHASATAGWRLRVGIHAADAEFIRRTAYLQLLVSGLAIAALIAFSIHLMRMIRRFVALKRREAAEAQLKSLGTMAASLAHEIRNPLGAMKGLTQLAQEELAAGHAAQAHLQTVVSEAERLEQLVTDLLDFARAREPQMRAFDLGELLADMQRMLQTRLEASKVALQFSVDPEPFLLHSDPAGLRQVLLNILMNALDATPAGGTIVVTGLREERRKSIRIQVDDSGAGLGPQSAEELFQPFVTTKVRGTGLGLAISRQIIESLGGRMHLENLPHRGARCSIILPLR